MHFQNRKSGFTLIELLVVIAIISLLSTVVFASVNTSREKARIAAGKQLDASIAQTLGDRLVGQWLFDDVSKPLIDSSGLNHNGTCTTCPTAVSGYNEGSGTLFNSLGYVTVGTGNDFFPMSAFSSCVWVKSSGLGPSMTRNGILSITYGVVMGLSSSGQFYTYLDDGVSLMNVAVAGNLHDDKFHHLCLTYDGNRRKMYVDGQSKYSSNATWLNTTRWPTNTVAIGTDVNNPPVATFNGVIDDVRIFSGAISEARVRTLFAIKPKNITSN